MGLEKKVIDMSKEYGKFRVYKAVIYGDRHTGIESASCDKILKNYIEDNKKDIKYVIDLGDGVDNPFMSIYPVNPDFVNSAQEDFDAYAKHLSEIDYLVPKAKKIIIPGNHDKSRIDNSKNLNRGLASLRNLQFESILEDSLRKYDVNMKNFTIANINYSIQFNKQNKAMFTHGDPRIDANIKGGLTGLRRTAESYPFEGDIYMGHVHEYKAFPRRFPGKQAVSLGGLFDIAKMESAYLNYHPYTNGFGVINYNPRNGFYNFQYFDIKDSQAFIDGKVYQGESK